VGVVISATTYSVYILHCDHVARDLYLKMNTVLVRLSFLDFDGLMDNRKWLLSIFDKVVACVIAMVCLSSGFQKGKKVLASGQTFGFGFYFCCGLI
jgi:hypothetical protein